MVIVSAKRQDATVVPRSIRSIFAPIFLEIGRNDDQGRKLLYLAHQNIARKWSMPIPNWAKIRNQLAIRFEGRFPL